MEYKSVFGTDSEEELAGIREQLDASGIVSQVRVRSNRSTFGLSMYGIDLNARDYEIFVQAEAVQKAVRIIEGSPDIPPENPVPEFHESEVRSESVERPDSRSRDTILFSRAMILAFFHLFGFGTIAAFYSLRQMTGERPGLKAMGYLVTAVAYVLFLLVIYSVDESVPGLLVMISLNLIVFSAYRLLNTGRKVFLILEIAGFFVFLMFLIFVIFL